MRRGAGWLLLLLAPLAAAAPVDVRDFFRHGEVNDIELSPTGEYLAVTVPQDDRTLLAILRTRDKGIVAKWDYGENMHAIDVLWVSDERFAIRVAEKFGSFDYLVRDPQLYFANADGSGRRRFSHGLGYDIVDVLPEDPDHILVQRTIERPHLYRYGVENGNLKRLAVSPVESGGFAVDRTGTVRYAIGENEKLKLETWRRDGERWTKLAEVDALAGDTRIPIGFAPDDRRIYMRASRGGGPDRVLLLDPDTGEETTLFEHPVADVGSPIWSHDGRRMLGVMFEPDYPRKKYFDGSDRETELLASLDAAFADYAVEITSTTRDGRLLLAHVYSDVDPGRFFLYDRDAGKATYLLSSRPWIDPAAMAPMKPVTVKARDGRELRGYLTLPRSGGKALPMIVNPHGGPHGVRDEWRFNPEVQYFASRGYAVLQLNYRGSGGYGREFMAAGYKRWGTAMQDDLTDAVNWAVGEGIADPARICIYGASYGGYAAMMSVVREPDLYRCAVGYVGVYSLPMMKRKGDIPESEFGRAFLERILPDGDAELRAQSPAYHAERIQVPVMLVQGRKDRRVPIAQMEFLIERMEDAGRSPEQVIVEDKEGHGFYSVDNNAELYPRMLAFFEKYIGRGGAVPASP